MRSLKPQARTARHLTRAARRKRAPRHPLAPEQMLKLATINLFDAYHAHLKAQIINYAPHHGRLRRDSEAASEAPQSSALKSIFDNVWSYGLQLLHTSPFKRIVQANAAATAKSARDQTAAALGLGDGYQPDLSKQTDAFAGSLLDSAAELMSEDSLERAADVLNEWEDLDPERSPRAGDTAALGGMLDDGLAGITGTALKAVGLAFGAAFGKLVRGAQEDAGVSHYAWMAQHDSVVRPEHLALDDGDVYAWDDPPLSPEDSSNGEACHPGDDYNCRCVASPVPPEEAPEQAALDE